MIVSSTSAETSRNNLTKRHYSAEEKAALIRRWKNSGLSKAAFCRREGIGESVFYAWTAPCKRKESSKSTGTQLNPAKLIANQAVPLVAKTAFRNSETLRVELASGIRVLIPLPASTDKIIKLIKGLACN